jgi:hypothetical protein
MGDKMYALLQRRADGVLHPRKPTRGAAGAGAPPAPALHARRRGRRHRREGPQLAMPVSCYAFNRLSCPWLK